MSLKNYILKDHVYGYQGDNLNPDGSSNMVWSKKWGRFNDCFVEGSVATSNQTVTRLREQGVSTPEGYKKTLLDPFTYKIGILNFLAPHKDVLSGDNAERFIWAKQCEYMNILLKASFAEKPPGEWRTGPFSLNKLISALKTKYQPIVGIWIKDYWPTGNGHVTNVIGWQEDENGKVTGLWFNDPAGNLLKKGSYKDASPIDGEEVFYPASVFSNIFKNNRQMIWFDLY